MKKIIYSVLVSVLASVVSMNAQTANVAVSVAATATTGTTVAVSVAVAVSSGESRPQTMSSGGGGTQSAGSPAVLTGSPAVLTQPTAPLLAGRWSFEHQWGLVTVELSPTGYLETWLNARNPATVGWDRGSGYWTLSGNKIALRMNKTGAWYWGSSTEVILLDGDITTISPEMVVVKTSSGQIQMNKVK